VRKVSGEPRDTAFETQNFGRFPGRIGSQFDSNVLNFVLKPYSHYVCIVHETHYDLHLLCALGETRTPNRLIRSQMLYPLSYERLLLLNLSGGIPVRATNYEIGNSELHERIKSLVLNRFRRWELPVREW
jgi:hypothetical protein